MPKIKEVLNNAKKGVEDFADKANDKLDHVVEDKHERAHECFDKLIAANLKLCFADNGKEIKTYDQIQEVSIGRIDIANEKVIEYCLAEFANQHIIKCEDVPTNLKTVGHKVVDGVADAFHDATHTPTPLEVQNDQHSEL